MTSNGQVFFILENAENNFRFMKNSNNNIKSSLPIPSNFYYQYRDEFSAILCIILAKPILAELKNRNQSLMSFVRELNDNGYGYNYTGFANAVKGKNPYVKSFSYFSKMYQYLSLPYPTMDYLNSFP